MSRIKGLNDANTLATRPPAATIKVWKGDKKTKNRAGANLENRFRIEAPPRLRKAIELAYNASRRGDSLYVDRLNLVPAYEDKYKTFDCRMAAYSASSPLLFCDRETINTKFVQSKDPYGNLYYQPHKTSEPCPVAGTNFKCPKGCSRTGDFYFYLYELLLQGYADFCRLQVHGVADNQTIATVLDETAASIGTIKQSPFVSEQTRTYIIYELTRSQSQYKFPVLENGKRTGKRGTKEDWIVSLSLHPLWLNKYNYHMSRQQLIKSGVNPSPKLIEQICDRSLVAAAVPELPAPADDVVEPEVECSTPTPFMDEAKFKELAAIWQQHGWHKNAIAEMLFSYFNISDRPALFAIDADTFAEIKRVSKSDRHSFVTDNS